jgi:hypothetical protein
MTAEAYAVPRLHRDRGLTLRAEAKFVRQRNAQAAGNTSGQTDLELPMEGLYLLAAPSTPDEARTEVICYCAKPRADRNAKNPEKKGCCSIASARGCQGRRTKQLVEKNRNPPKSRQQSIAGATAGNRGNAQSSPFGNCVPANQESLDPKLRLSA